MKKGKKNPLGRNFKRLKCFCCSCDHEENCACPCVYHMANKYDKQDTRIKKNQARVDIGLFMKVCTGDLQTENAMFMMDEKKQGESQDILLLADTLEKLCLAAGFEKDRALINCGCPNIVAGIAWIKYFISNLSEKEKQKIEVKASNRVYKFGGGERRPSKCQIRLPCCLAGNNITIKTEVVDVDLPLLKGNRSLEKGDAHLHINSSKIELMGNMLPMKRPESGHYSLEIGIPQLDKKVGEAELCLAVKQEELLDDNLQKLHHYWGHTSINKLSKLIQDAGRMCQMTKTNLRRQGVNV